MKATPYNPVTDLAPIPFSDSLCQAAKALKQSGLQWEPHVGCFVWDEFGKMTVPSPFPNNIYFILNLGQFIRILGSVDHLKNNMVWLPTMHQTQQLIAQYPASAKPNEPLQDIYAAYAFLLSLLNS
jgi:hypothetical protein